MTEPAWPRDALPQGTMLHGYRIVGMLGRGGFGTTYRAVDGIDQGFAIKEYFPRQFAVRQGLEVLPADDASREMFADCLERFTREARALTLFSKGGGGGSGVVRVMTYFEANGTAYIVMELLEGQTLDRVIAAQPGGLAEHELRHMLEVLLPALGRVHENGLLHRDIKPANIFVRNDGDPVLLDFGAARATQPGQTSTYTSIFTETYAPIEQIQGLPQGPYSDIYALGMTCYQAIAGKGFETGRTMSLTRQAALLRQQADPLRPAAEMGAGRYTEPLLHGIDTALRVAPEERPQSVHEFGAALGLGTTPAAGAGPGEPADAATRVLPRPGLAETVAQPKTETAARLPPTQIMPPKARGSSLPWLLVGMGFVAVAAGAGLWVKFGAKPAASPPPAPVPTAPAAIRPPAAFLTPPAPPAAVTAPAANKADQAYQSGDYAAALALYRPAGDAGDRHAQYQLGRLYGEGKGVARDPVAALDWYRKAAEQNDAAAQSQVGYYYLSGLAGARDYGEALRWYQLAASQHAPEAEYQLGYMAQHGLGMRRDFAEMLRWYQAAADAGLPAAQQQLGYSYQMGLGMKPDAAQAVHWYRLAAEQGLPAGMYSLGQMLFDGIGVPADSAAGRSWIAKAAAAGSGEAARWVATH